MKTLQILSVWLKPWKEDKWLSIIDSPFKHPDKLGHLVANFSLALLFYWLTGDTWHAILWDIWFNTQIEIMDGTRPRRKLYGALPVRFTSQDDYEKITIEGFSLKDWLAGFAGMCLASLWILYV